MKFSNFLFLFGGFTLGIGSLFATKISKTTALNLTTAYARGGFGSPGIAVMIPGHLTSVGSSGHTLFIATRAELRISTLFTAASTGANKVYFKP